MKTTMIRAALACAALALPATAVFAEGGPISDIPVGVDHDPGGSIAVHTTDARGSATFAGLRPGRYAVVLTGPALVAAMDRMARGGHRVSGLTIAIAGGAVAFSTTAPVCRDSAGRGLRIGFTISDQASAGNIAVRPGDVRVTISDQGAAGGLISY